MHEYFTTAAVKNSEVVGILMTLQGLCGMTPVRQLERRIIFEGPKTNPLTGIGASQLQSRKPMNLPLWRELNEQLVRQSYYISVSHEINEFHFGKQTTPEGNNGSLEDTLWVPRMLIVLWTDVVTELLILRNYGQLYIFLTTRTP
jgi:hypothetical protein